MKEQLGTAGCSSSLGRVQLSFSYGSEGDLSDAYIVQNNRLDFHKGCAHVSSASSSWSGVQYAGYLCDSLDALKPVFAYPAVIFN
jgi:hypothetical protein